ncbi:MAG: hypothetical protein C5B59_13345 [Bacteroidetes bacterium]|nr:MAG: hypothetical protein C5B59_13345 [Bacteroidota bacterium]
MKLQWLILGWLLLQPVSRSNNHFEFIDPTGTYILKGVVQKNRIIGHSGELRVKLLLQDRIAISFYISSGYPNFASVSFVDTLSYEENSARYFPTGHSGCSLVFCFNYHDVELQQTYTDPVAGCGFANGAVISTSFKKKSAEQPLIQDLSCRGTGV